MEDQILTRTQFELENICRTCTEHYEKSLLIPIFKHNTKLEIQAYQIIKHFLDPLEIAISEDDSMPQNICKECYSKFFDFWNFLDKCIDSNNNLFSLLEKSKACIERSSAPNVKVNENNQSHKTLQKVDNHQSEFANETVDLLTLPTIKQEDEQLISVIKDHDYQEISLDILEGNSDNLDETVEILEENFIEYVNDNIRIDYTPDSEIQIVENENIALQDCSYCNYAFSAEYFNDHLKEYHPDNSPFLCTKCFRNFRTLSIRDKHVLLNMCTINESKLIEFQNNAVEVFVADDSFDESKNVSEDEYNENNQNIAEDLQNENTMNTYANDSLKNTKNVSLKINDNNNDSIKCPICSEEFTRSKNLFDHLKRSHPDFNLKLIQSKYVCDFCDKDCKTKQSLESHLNSHKGIKPYECQICKTRFFGSKPLRTHISNEHSALQFTCEICGKEFIKKSVFLTHMSNHKKDSDPNRKPDIKYKCQFCPRTFNTVSTLTIHSLTHKKLLDSKHICNVCGVTFKRADHLKMHMYGVHLDHKPFPCEQCDKSFPTAWQRNTHVKKYHSADKKKYKCDICTNEYASSNALKRHKMVHTGELKYNCDVCDQKFSKIFLLEEHLKTHEIDENLRRESINEVYMEIAKSVIISN